MSNKTNKRLSLAGVISKVKHISEVHHDGKIYDNIMPIFNQLSTAEKRVLLRGLIGICFMIEERIVDSPDHEKPHHTASPEDSDTNDDESFVSKKDDLSKKPWSFKAMGIALIVGMIALSAATFFLSGENGLLSKISRFIEIVKKGSTG